MIGSKVEYRTVDTRTEKGLKEAEKLKAAGWEIGSVGLYTIQFFKKPTKKTESKALSLIEMLDTEQNTPQMRKKIEAAVRKKFPRKKGSDVFFEHGHWWVQFTDGSQYDVVDAEGPGTINGFDFEIVTEPDEY